MPRRTRSVPHDWYHDEDYARVRERGVHSRRRSRSSSSSGLGRGERLKTVGKLALAAVKLGGAAAILAGERRSRGRSLSDAKPAHSSHRRSHSSSSPSSHSLSYGDGRIKQALQAAITAGAAEAFRARHEPGDLFGPKGERILTAAITAAGVDGVIDRDPNKHSKRHIIESALAGLAAERAINGPR